MSYIELFLLAAGLCFDTFAVSLTGGICTQGSLGPRQILKIILCFAVFQAGLSFAGWLLGYSVSDYISGGFRAAWLYRCENDSRGMLKGR